LAREGEGTLSHLQNGQYVRIAKGAVDPTSFLSSFSGNRITVNGFAMSLKKASRILGAGKNRIAMILDIDIKGDKDVQYDISRERIIGAGRNVVVDALEQAILSGLRDTGVLDRLAPETRRVIDNVRLIREQEAKVVGFLGQGETLRPTDPEQVLDEVERLIPNDQWPLGLHKIIAQKLSITNGLAHRAITTLMRRGRIVNPNASATEAASPRAENI
jgi:hypothetical protein